MHVSEYDLVTMFDCLHNMGDPVSAAAQSTPQPKTQRCLADCRTLGKRHTGGKPQSDRPHLLFGVYVHWYPGFPVTGSRSLPGGQAGEARLKDVVMQGGFNRFMRATQTLFNLVLEAKT